MLRYAIVLGVLGIGGCSGDETVGAYGAAGKTWTLGEIGGVPFTGTATLRFPETGRIAGQAPCNGFSGVMDAPYPWFEAREIVATRRACPDLDLETDFFDALTGATQSEVAGDTLVLRDDDGHEMVFTASE